MTLFGPLAGAAYFFGSDTHVGVPPLVCSHFSMFSMGLAQQLMQAFFVDSVLGEKCAVDKDYRNSLSVYGE